jgi:hypothetical protein
MDGKEAMRIGGTTPFAMTVTDLTGMDMFSQGMTINRERTGRTNIDSARKANRIRQSKWLGASASPNQPLKGVNFIKLKPGNF